jgi:hypothetical protein
MSEPGDDLVERLHREAVERHREQTRKERELVEATFRDALERERQEKAQADALLDQVHREAVEYYRRNPPPPREQPRGVHYTELPEARPGQALAEEWNTYRREVGRLLAEGREGRHVLIKGNEIIGIFETWEEAYGTGVKRYLLGPFFVHTIRTEEPYLRVRGINYPWPNLRSR